MHLPRIPLLSNNLVTALVSCRVPICPHSCLLSLELFQERWGTCLSRGWEAWGKEEQSHISAMSPRATYHIATSGLVVLPLPCDPGIPSPSATGPRALCSSLTYPCSGSGHRPLVGILAPGMQLLFHPAGSLLCLSLRVPLDHTPAPTPDSTGIYPGWAAAFKPHALLLSVSLAPWRGTGMTGCAGCFISHQVVCVCGEVGS